MSTEEARLTVELEAERARNELLKQRLSELSGVAATLGDIARDQTERLRRARQTILDSEIEIDALKRQLALKEHKLELQAEAQHQFCPDCRDKVSEEPCLRCQRDTLKRRVRNLEQALFKAQFGKLREE